MEKMLIRAVQIAWKNPERIPADWTRVVTRLIPKPGRDSSKIEGWRPIAVGTAINKIVMIIWCKRLERVALRKGWIHERQFGFVRGKTMKGVAEFLSEKIDEIPGAKVLQWDLEKAFPSIEPEAVGQMLQHLGVPCPFVNIMRGFYTNAPMAAVIAGIPGGEHQKCRWKHEWGLKQGCPASPLLLNLWTEPIVRHMSGVTNFVQYADDMWAVDREENVKKIRIELERRLKKAGLVVNLEKEKVWTKNSTEALVALGMLVKEGKRETVTNQIDSVMISGIMRGMEREYRVCRLEEGRFCEHGNYSEN